MALDANIDHLVKTLEALPVLDGRYEKLQHINPTRGYFSVVFKAHDRVENRPVAIKFYSISNVCQTDTYRRDAFRREPQILSTLLNKQRCLQLAGSLTSYALPIPVPGGGSVSINCEYFVVEWIDADIDAFFFKPGATDAIVRLQIFREIILAVEALHSLGVFHRDLKMDNLRAAQRALQRVVVAIDLGTAARSTSERLVDDYRAQTGAVQYAAPEALGGLAGNRSVARYTDVYALGCMLFELFNPDLFFKAFLLHNPLYQSVIHGMQGYVVTKASEADQEKQWRQALADLGSGVTRVDIDGLGSTVPPGISGLLKELFQGLTHLNYARRPTLEWARTRVDSAIRVLRNQAEYARQNEIKKAWRKARVERQRLKDERLKIVRARIPAVSHA